MRVGIINVTGYAGAELARILYRHPEARITSVTGRSAVGEELGQVFPHLSALGLTISPELGGVDVAFSALPHGASAAALLPLIRDGIPVVDISADFRLKDPVEYQAWYGVAHPAPELLGQSVYGLVELNRDRLATAKVVANPGCFPTGAVLALAPAVKAGIIVPDIVVDAKSGVSGAGRATSLHTHFSEANENLSAYALDGHRHLPEMTQELAWLHSGPPPAITFLPHLAPMTRGILTSCYAPLVPGTVAAGDGAKAEVRELYREFYRGEPFVKVVDIPPQTKQTWGNNLCLIYPTVDPRTGRLIVVSCIDNLVKGAAGQAIQCMNLMLGYPETMGLEALAVYP